ncbi:hypothetical protein KC19_3G084500, partial [Ceratodon purpureus]
ESSVAEAPPGAKVQCCRGCCSCRLRRKLVFFAVRSRCGPALVLWKNLGGLWEGRTREVEISCGGRDVESVAELHATSFGCSLRFRKCRIRHGVLKSDCNTLVISDQH